MRRTESLIVEIYHDHSDLWKTAWRRQVVKQLAAEVKKCFISIEPLVVSDGIELLSDPVKRLPAIFCEQAVEPIIDELVTSEGEFRAKLSDACKASSVDAPTVAKIRKALKGLVEESLRSPSSTQAIIEEPEHEVYTALAHLLSAELFSKAPSDLKSLPDGVVWNYSLIVYYLQRWVSPFSHLKGRLMKLNEGGNGIRGKLLSIQSIHRESNNVSDFLLPVIPFAPLEADASILSLSDSLDVIMSESRQIHGGCGFLTRLLPIHNPVRAGVLADSRHGTQELAEKGRRLTYPQFEHTALIFMALGSIEFLLRSLCPVACSVDDRAADLIRLHHELSPTLRDDLNKLFSRKGWNVRNRCMHGMFLEVEARREDLLRESGILENHGVPIATLDFDGSLPGNVSAIVVRTLQALCEHFNGRSSCRDTTWTEHFALTADELKEANTIYCDLRTKEAAEAWLSQIGEFLIQAAPSLSTPLKLGIQTWFRSNDSANDTLPPFHFLMLLFEPLLRLTLHLGGKRVLKSSWGKGSGTEKVLHVDYIMMDWSNLLAIENFHWLVQHLNTQESKVAERTLRLAVKCRDAFAHGAVHRFDMGVQRLYGHIMIKAIQLVSEAGQRALDAGDIPVAE